MDFIELILEFGRKFLKRVMVEEVVGRWLVLCRHELIKEIIKNQFIWCIGNCNNLLISGGNLKCLEMKYLGLRIQ